MAIEGWGEVCRLKPELRARVAGSKESSRVADREWQIMNSFWKLGVNGGQGCGMGVGDWQKGWGGAVFAA
jgi:hypothetical protein